MAALQATSARATNCTIYEEGTDVRLTIHGVHAKVRCDSEIGALSASTGNAWSYTQRGNNYAPAEASTVCTFTRDGFRYTIADAGFRAGWSVRFSGT